jgi:regulatory protein
MEWKRKYTPEETRQRIREWCDRGERAHQDVRAKLFRWNIPSGETEGLIAELIRDNLLNEERYASAFASDHFRIHRWGNHKIAQALRRKGVSDRNIQTALAALPREDESEIIRSLIRKLEPKLKGLQIHQKKYKIVRYLISRGFESDRSIVAAEHFLSAER